MLSWESFRSSTNWVGGTIIYIISSTSRIYGQIRIFMNISPKSKVGGRSRQESKKPVFFAKNRVFKVFISVSLVPRGRPGFSWSSLPQPPFGETQLVFGRELLFDRFRILPGNLKRMKSINLHCRSYFIYFIYGKRPWLLLGFQISSNLILLEKSWKIIKHHQFTMSLLKVFIHHMLIPSIFDAWTIIFDIKSSRCLLSKCLRATAALTGKEKQNPGNLGKSDVNMYQCGRIRDESTDTTYITMNKTMINW